MPRPRSNRRTSLTLVFLATAGLLTAGLSVALTADETDTNEASSDRPADSLDRDYSDELPRIDPKEPEEAMKTFSVADGFDIELVASEPTVVDPIAMSFDEDGRLYIVEMRGYSEDADDHLGRIRLLEDTNGDGYFDSSTVFIDGLSWPTAIHCYDGGVFVGVPPDILYLKDTSGDGSADQEEVVFTGFHRTNVQGMMNTFTWGLDNRIHVATSSVGASISRPGVEEEEPLELRGRDFAFDPHTRRLEPTSGGGQHGWSFNTWGEKFVCSNSDHIQMVMFEDRYVARNPYLAAPSPRISIAADGPAADVYRTSPVEPWRIVRTRLRVQGIVPGPIEGGGRAAGYFTGATGLTMYRGDAWPQEYLNWAIVGDVGGNLIHRKRLDQDGVEYIAHRVDEESEFVTSTDIWFRPVQFGNAPDGTLYVLDMYREVIEHPDSLPPIIKQHLDLTSGRDRGRIYRIVPDDFQQPELPRLSGASLEQLVAKLDHSNGWHRETAARLLYERNDPAAVPLLQNLVSDAERPEGVLRALYALDSLNALTPAILQTALGSANPHVRRHAVRLSETAAQQSDVLRESLYRMADDPDMRVRYQVAFSLGELSGPTRNATLARLARRDADDRWIRLAVLSSLREGAGHVLHLLATDTTFMQLQASGAWLEALAAQIGRDQGEADVAYLMRTLQELGTSHRQQMGEILAALDLRPDAPLARRLAAATDGQADEIREQMVAEATEIAADRELSPQQRTRAIGTLTVDEFERQQSLLQSLLDPAEPLPVQQAALNTLAAYRDAAVAEMLIERWSTLSPQLRSRAADVLLLRDAWTRQLLDSVLAGNIATGELDLGRLRLLAEHDDPEIAQQVQEVLDSIQLGQRADVIEQYQSVLEMAGDAHRGREVFHQHCAACHRLEGTGHEIGPNLAAMASRGAESVLVNVLDPNREVNPEYLNYAVMTSDGRTLSGMIAGETATSLTLKRADDETDTVLRVDIEQMRSTGQSLMPEGLEREIDPQAMADLIAYLESIDS